MLLPYVGILINDKLHRSLPSGKTKYEAVEFYVEAGHKFGFTPCFFRIQDYNAEQSMVKAYVKQGDRFVLATVPAPQVVHNRAIYPGEREYRKLDALTGGGLQLFNRWNRYGKLEIHELLRKNPSLEPHLPETCAASPANIACMMKRFDTLIIKPNRSSIGRGVTRLARTGNGWQLTYPVSMSIHNTKWRTVRSRGPGLPGALLGRLRRTKYIVQQCLPLATYKGRPFDLRVSVQRGWEGDWQITGIVAKAASKKSFVTNVAQGGTVHRLESILREEYRHLNPEAVYLAVSRLSVGVARHLGQWLPNMADLGLDIGITAEGYPLFIECNGKDQRYSFREAGMLDEWKATYENPMAYASFLLSNGKSVSQRAEIDG